MSEENIAQGEMINNACWAHMLDKVLEDQLSYFATLAQFEIIHDLCHQKHCKFIAFVLSSAMAKVCTEAQRRDIIPVQDRTMGLELVKIIQEIEKKP